MALRQPDETIEEFRKRLRRDQEHNEKFWKDMEDYKYHDREDGYREPVDLCIYLVGVD